MFLILFFLGTFSSPKFFIAIHELILQIDPLDMTTLAPSFSDSDCADYAAAYAIIRITMPNASKEESVRAMTQRQREVVARFMDITDADKDNRDKLHTEILARRWVSWKEQHGRCPRRWRGDAEEKVLAMWMDEYRARADPTETCTTRK